MILQWFADMFYKIMTSLLDWIELPGLSDDLVNVFDELFNFFLMGAHLFNFFIPSSVYKVMLPIAVGLVGIKYAYFLIMWMLKKIPMAGVN